VHARDPARHRYTLRSGGGRVNPDVQEVFEDMKLASRHLQDATERLKEVQAGAVIAAHNAEVAWDEAFLSAEGTEQTRKSIANIASKDLRLEAEGQKAQVRMIRNDVQAWSSILSGLQTTMSALKEESRFARTGPNY
jgi:hypothetical protein